MNREKIIQSLALRSFKGTSGKLNLGVGGEDYSDGGRWWLELKATNSQGIDALRNAFVPSFMEGDKLRRDMTTAGLVKALVELNLIKDAVLPGIDEKTDEIMEMEYPRDSRVGQFKFVEKFPPAMTELVAAMAARFYSLAGDDDDDEESLTTNEVLDDLGNSSTPQAAPQAEAATEQ